MSDSVWPHRQQPTRLPCPWDSPGKNTGVGCHFLLHAWRWKMKVKSLSRVRLWATPQTAAYQAPPSMGFSRQEYWSGVPSPSPKQLSLGITKFTKLINQFTSPEMNPKEDITSEGSSFITLSIYSNLATFLVIKKHILAYVQCLKKYFFLRTEIIQLTAQ